MTQVVPVQKVSWVAALAVPPVASRPMLRVVLSEERRTW
jgi:hypothetical protein